jgi:signal transduction histidine kinase
MTPAKGEPRHQADRRPPLVDVLDERGGDEEIAELRARIAELEREIEGLEDFAARAAHELVAPLVMTEAYSAMVATRLDRTAHADALRDLDAIGRASAQARRLVEALLDEARAGDEPLEREQVELGSVVTDVVRTLQPEIAARAVLVEAGPLPAVHGERTLLTGLFINLIVNGLRYGPREGGCITVAAAPEHPSAWRVTVDSDGPTITAEDSERIFAPYQRGPHERRMRGAGLGLAISRRVVERHGGRMGVLPLPDGNRFWFTLPAA